MCVAWEAKSESFTERKAIRKFQITSSAANVVASSESTATTTTTDKVNTISSYWRTFAGGSGGGGAAGSRAGDAAASTNLRECFQVEFHPTIRNLIFLVHPRETFIFDLEINQTIGYLQLDRSDSPNLQVSPIVKTSR